MIAVEGLRFRYPAGGFELRVPALGIAAGETRATLAFTEESGRWDEGGITMQATQSGDGWTLDGVKSYVLDGATATPYGEVDLSGFPGPIDVVELGGVPEPVSVDAGELWTRTPFI